MTNELENGSTFHPCPSEIDHPFAMIPNDLLRNPDISPECRWLIAFLLSNSGDWKISMPYILKSQRISKNRMYNLVNQAMEAGYLKRDTWLEGGLKKFKYIISRTPKFKKCLPCPQKEDLENEDAKEYQVKNTNKEPLYISPKPKKTKPQKEAKEGFGSVVKLSKAEHSNLVAFMGIEALNELIERANEYCEINDRKYSNYFALLKAWHKRDLKNPKFSKKSQGDKNKILAQKIIEKYGDSHGVHISENALVFPNQGAGGDFFFKFDIPNFEGQVRNRMELMRLVFPKT